MVRPGLDGILIPKVNSIEDVDPVSHYVDVLEVATGVAPGHVKLLFVATETPAAMIGFSGYTRKNTRLVAMTWGRRPERGLGRAHNKEANGAWAFPYQVARAQCLFAAGVAAIRSMRTSGIRMALRIAVASRAMTASSAGSRSTRIRSRPSIVVSRRQMPILRTLAASSRRLPRRQMWALSVSTGRCTTFRTWSRHGEP